MVEYPMMPTATARWSSADQVSGLRHSACSKKMSAVAAIGVQRLSDNAHVRDPGLLHRIHYGRECPEGHVLVGTDENGLMLRVTHLLPYFSCNFVDVDRVVAEKDTLRLVDGNDHALFGDLFDGACLGDRDLDTGLQDGGSNDEDDQQHQDDIDKRSDVDVCQGSLGPPVGGGERH